MSHQKPSDHKPSNDKIPDEHHVHRTGGWLPQDHRVHKDWLHKTIAQVDSNPKELHPVLTEFKEMVEADWRLYMLFTAMFDEIPSKKLYNKDPVGNKQVEDFGHMLKLLNHILTTAPHWSDKSESVGMVGTPFNAILDWPMGTPSGYIAFIDPEVNAMWKKVLDAWGEFLTSPASAEVLGEDSHCWFGEVGTKDLEMTANEAAGTSHEFVDLFHCDPSAKHHGYKSWDDFFTRPFKEDARPVASPEDDNVIANSCESMPYNVAYDIKLRDKFWIKGQPYSCLDILAQDPIAEQFAGGTIYQAFLSALSYHRWHSPVSGTIRKAFIKDGTYFSEPLFETMGDPKSHDIDMAGESTGQGYLSASATRAIIYIEADNPAIGLMAFIGIGMTEVSTCDITVKEGQHLKKGDQLGMFHFGGSTHCLMFRKGVVLGGFPQPGRKSNVPVRSKLAVVKST